MSIDLVVNAKFLRQRQGRPLPKILYIYGYIQIKKLERLKERKKIETLGVTLSPQI